MRQLTIGLFFRLQGPDGSRLFRGCSELAAEDGRITLRCWDVAMWPKDGITRELGLDGVIAQVFPMMNTPEAMAAPAVPIVNVSPCCKDCRLPAIVPDDEGVGRAAAGYFLRRGYRHFLYCGHEVHGASERRYAGFRRELEAAGFDAPMAAMPPLPEEMYHVAAARASAPEKAWLASRGRPLAVLCFSDYEAAFVIRSCRAAGVRVPAEIAVLGTNNDDAYTRQAPTGLSSIDPGFDRVGYEALLALARHLRERAPLQPQVVRSFKIVERSSTNAYAIGDELIQNAMDYIEQHKAEPLDIQALARAMGVSRRVLERRFHEKVNSTIHQAIQHARVEAAKNAILQSDAAMKDVALACGFTDSAHMSRVFRSITGHTPSALRRKQSA